MIVNTNMKQQNYDFKKYNGIERWCSYYYQIKEILELNSHTILEVGVGSNILKDILIGREMNYSSCDIDKNIKPDYLQDISKLNINRKFDIICAFQVLEHLPFNLFEKSLIKMKEHSNKYVLISLPRYGMKFRFSFKIPNIKSKSLSFKIPTRKEFKFNGEHHWEIDSLGMEQKEIERIIGKHFNILKSYIIPENAYHKLYVLEVKTF